MSATAENTATYTALGRLLAVVEAATGVHPTALGNCLAAPKTFLMGQYLGRAMPKLRAMPELDAIVAEIMDSLSVEALDGIPDATPLADQGAMQIAYYQQRGKLPPVGPKPKTPTGVDWAKADWSKSDQALADEHGVSRQAAMAARKRHTKGFVALPARA